MCVFVVPLCMANEHVVGVHWRYTITVRKCISATLSCTLTLMSVVDINSEGDLFFLHLPYQLLSILRIVEQSNK